MPIHLTYINVAVKVCWSTAILASLVRVGASRDTALPRTFFRAVSEQCQSSFRGISEQFQSSFRANLEKFQSSFRAVSEQFQSSFIFRFYKFVRVRQFGPRQCAFEPQQTLPFHALLSEQFQSSFRAVSGTIQSSFTAVFFSDFTSLLEYGNLGLVSARLSLNRHYPSTDYFQSSFRAVSGTIQSSFRAVSGTIQSSFRAVLFSDFTSLVECGNFGLVSARLSLKRHYPFTYYFRSSFRADFFFVCYSYVGDLQIL